MGAKEIVPGINGRHFFHGCIRLQRVLQSGALNCLMYPLSYIRSGLRSVCYRSRLSAFYLCICQPASGESRIVSRSETWRHFLQKVLERVNCANSSRWQLVGAKMLREGKRSSGPSGVSGDARSQMTFSGMNGVSQSTLVSIIPRKPSMDDVHKAGRSSGRPRFVFTAPITVPVGHAPVLQSL